MYFLLGTCLVFAFLLALNVCTSVFASIAWRLLARRAAAFSARKQERIIFALRIFPVAAAIVFVVGLLVPAYLIFEPEASGEAVSLKLGLVSFFSLLGIGTAAFRVFRTLTKTKRLLTCWLENAERLTIENVDIPVFRIEHPFPLIAVVGLFRPRLFIAAQIFDSLSDAEFRSALAHEYGHLAARDNLKRTVLRICRDMLIFPLGKQLDLAWAANVESAADEYAASVGGNSMALDLAETLIKIARIVPRDAIPAMPLGSFLTGHHPDDLRKRIRRLIELSDRSANVTTPGGKYSVWMYLGAIFAMLPFLAFNKAFLLAIHNVTETVVAFLQ
jgi:Zn-dependent protease with chaperone function